MADARELAAALGQWAASEDAAEPEAPATRRAMDTADELVSELMRVERAVEARWLWNLPGHPFARTGGDCLHVRECFYVDQSAEAMFAAGHQPLSRREAEAYLRESHDHYRCTVCAPGISEPPWVRVQTAGGRVRWRLADSPPRREA
jgi:hypothetical protein